MKFPIIALVLSLGFMLSGAQAATPDRTRDLSHRHYHHHYHHHHHHYHHR
jgi:hypothetical protein